MGKHRINAFLLAQFLGLFSLFLWRKFVNNSSEYLIFQIVAFSISTTFIFHCAIYLSEKYMLKTKFKILTEINVIYSCLSIVLFFTLTMNSLGNIDRSRSLYMLHWISCAPKGSNLEIIETQIQKKYGLETKLAFDFRIAEQINRGIVKIVNKRPILSTSGMFILRVAQIEAKAFELHGWERLDLWQNPKCIKGFE